MADELVAKSQNFFGL